MEKHELRITNYKLWAMKILCASSLFIAAAFHAHAQSGNQNFPTPITANEISGRIPARDLGDARLTTYFYTFDGTQGDVFINVVTTNFNGDIDVFTADNLRPLAKITAYADASSTETGRVVYLRQPLKLILRIQGRTPNDDAATFQIKFAGSFAPSTAVAGIDETPAVKSNTASEVRVNSVGTIIEIKPTPTPTPTAVIAKVEKPVKERKPKAAENAENAENSAANEKIIKEKPVAKEKTVQKEPKPQKAKPVKPPTPVAPPVAEQTAEKDAAITEKPITEPPPEAETRTENKTPEKEIGSAPKDSKEKKKANAVKAVPPAALESINLIVLFKDGTKIERPMSEILKVGVDKGILTVISKDGTIGRYSILDVEKMTIQ